MSARPRGPQPSGPRAPGPREKTCCWSASSWLHLLRSWSLRSTRGGSKAMMVADKAGLEVLVADQLSYGHSGGVIETKEQFIAVIANKKTVYKSIMLSEPSVAVVGNNAIVRHIFSAETESDGKAASARVGVLQVWQKQDDRWKLLARQAFRLPA